MPEPLRDLRRGDSALENWREINKQAEWLRDHHRRLAALDADVAYVRTKRKYLEGGGGASVQRLLVQSVADDYLVCARLGADGLPIAGTEQHVAKPFNLRRTGWHGVTVTYTLEAYPGSPGVLAVSYSHVSATYRTATIASYTEHQVIRPAYVPGQSVIFAAEAENGSGVTGASLVDLNADARAWTMVA